MIRYLILCLLLQGSSLTPNDSSTAASVSGKVSTGLEDCSQGNICSGTYTAVTTNEGGSITSCVDTDVISYTRIGSYVLISGGITCTFSASAGDGVVDVSLPIASNFDSTVDCVGSASANTSTSNVTGGFVVSKIVNPGICYINIDGDGVGIVDRQVNFSMIYVIK